MKIAMFSARSYDRLYFDRVAGTHELTYFESHLRPETVRLAQGIPAVCVFVNDQVDHAVIDALASGGTKLLALRSAGYNHVDMEAARDAGLTVVRVPGYSPHAVAEHTVALILALNRKIPRAHARVREANFSLDGLLGFDLHGKTVGLVGTGKIGRLVGKIMHGFGCRLLAVDPYAKTGADVPIELVDAPTLFAHSDIITLHCPVTPETHHIINDESVELMKDGVMLINTSRGGLIDTRAVVDALKSGRVGYLGLDVYEEEADLFFDDLSNMIMTDDVFARLLTFPNVLITGHQGFFTDEALADIAETTIANIDAFAAGRSSGNEIH